MDIVKLIIERDTSTKVPVEVNEYEVPVLRQLHGPGRVSEVSRRDMTDDEQERFDSKSWEEAYEHLQLKYPRGAASEALLTIYPNLEALIAWSESAPQRAKAEASAQRKADAAQAKADAAQAEADRIATESRAAADAEAAKAAAAAQKQVEKDVQKETEAADKADKGGKAK